MDTSGCITLKKVNLMSHKDLSTSKGSIPN